MYNLNPNVSVYVYVYVYDLNPNVSVYVYVYVGRNAILPPCGAILFCYTLKLFPAFPPALLLCTIEQTKSRKEFEYITRKKPGLGRKNVFFVIHSNYFLLF